MRRLVGAGRGGTPRRQASAETVFGAQNLGEIARQLAGWRRHGGGWRLVIAIPLREESLSREPVGVEPEPWFSLPRAGFGELSGASSSASAVHASTSTNTWIARHSFQQPGH